jgi:type II secretory pathway component PulK
MASPTERRRDTRSRKRKIAERGIALVVVSSVLAVIMALTQDFSYDSTIDYSAAANARDEMRAHFLARSAVNLSRLVIKVQHDVIDRNRSMVQQFFGSADVQLADYVPMIMGAFGGGKEEVDSIASAIGNIDTTAIKGLGLPEGTFDVEVSTDDGKINVNCANGQQNTVKQLEAMLIALVAPGVYDRIFEERDGDGQYTDRATFIKALMDWADRDTAAYGANGQPEEYGYESLSDPYEARDNYLDSIDELQLVRGMDDRRWQIFGPSFTIYGGCKVNLGAAQDLGVIAAIIWQTAKNPQDPVLLDPMKFYALVSRVAQARQFGIMFDKPEDFISFVKEPDALLAELFGAGTSGTSSATAAQQAGFMPVEGIELDAKKLGDVARTGGRRTYRIKASARIGKVEKIITGIWDSDTINQNPRDPAYAKGTWVYWREE